LLFLAHQKIDGIDSSRALINDSCALQKAPRRRLLDDFFACRLLSIEITIIRIVIPSTKKDHGHDLLLFLLICCGCPDDGPFFDYYSLVGR
jgi:hypothetical protein